MLFAAFFFGVPAARRSRSLNIAMEEAIAAYTAGSAWAAHRETHTGRVVVGYDADLVVLLVDDHRFNYLEVQQHGPGAINWDAVIDAYDAIVALDDDEREAIALLVVAVDIGATKTLLALRPIAELDKEIENLLFETRVRREVVSETLATLLERAAARRQPPGRLRSEPFRRAG